MTIEKRLFLVLFLAKAFDRLIDRMEAFCEASRGKSKRFGRREGAISSLLYLARGSVDHLGYNIALIVPLEGFDGSFEEQYRLYCTSRHGLTTFGGTIPSLS